MFDFRWTEKAEPTGVIRHRKGEHPKSLGSYTDMDGKHWDIHGIFSPGFDGGWVWACSYHSLHPYYRDTSTMSFGLVSQRWEPYLLEIVND